jgi:CheY-like chemotaxis protein
VPCRAILVVDDDPYILELIRIRLTQVGDSITCAGNGAEAIEAIAHTTFDAVVTDILMPVRDGFEVIGEVRRQQPNARIIAMSGGGRAPRDEYLDLARGMGAHAVLAKPFNDPQLTAAIETALTK